MEAVKRECGTQRPHLWKPDYLDSPIHCGLRSACTHHRRIGAIQWGERYTRERDRTSQRDGSPTLIIISPQAVSWLLVHLVRQYSRPSPLIRRHFDNLRALISASRHDTAVWRASTSKRLIAVLHTTRKGGIHFRHTYVLPSHRWCECPCHPVSLCWTHTIAELDIRSLIVRYDSNTNYWSLQVELLRILGGHAHWVTFTLH